MVNINSKLEVSMESKEQLRKIAIYCDEYDSKISNDKHESCTNCSHYHNLRCDLDLIDKVLSSLSMDLDLKS